MQRFCYCSSCIINLACGISFSARVFAARRSIDVLFVRTWVLSRGSDQSMSSLARAMLWATGTARTAAGFTLSNPPLLDGGMAGTAFAAPGCHALKTRSLPSDRSYSSRSFAGFSGKQRIQVPANALLPFSQSTVCYILPALGAPAPVVLFLLGGFGFAPVEPWRQCSACCYVVKCWQPHNKEWKRPPAFNAARFLGEKHRLSKIGT